LSPHHNAAIIGEDFGNENKLPENIVALFTDSPETTIGASKFKRQNYVTFLNLINPPYYYY